MWRSLVNCNLHGAYGQTGHVKTKQVDGGDQINGRNFCVTINSLK